MYLHVYPIAKGFFYVLKQFYFSDFPPSITGRVRITSLRCIFSSFYNNSMEPNASIINVRIAF